MIAQTSLRGVSVFIAGIFGLVRPFQIL